MFGALALLVAGAFAFYYYVNSRSEVGKRALSIKRMALIETALEKYCVDCGGNLPTEKQGLKALLQRPTESPVPRGWRGPYLEDTETVQDAWGRAYKYVCPGGPVERRSKIMRPYDLASYGRDGQEGGVDLDRDICSWDRGTMIP